MTSRDLDQFYTNPIIAKELFNLTLKTVKDPSKLVFLEPSAGSGSFSKLFPPNSIALDIDPKAPNIIKMDFLEFQAPFDNALVIGNPPFGKNSSLAIKFFNKSALFSKYICMILPKTFRKDSVVNKLDLNLHLVEERTLPYNSFVFNMSPYHVPCVFQIWEKRDFKRTKIPQKLKTSVFEFSTKSNSDFAIRRVGALAGKIFKNFDNYSPNSHYFINIDAKFDKNKVFEIIDESFDQLHIQAQNSAGNPSLSKHELISIIEKNPLFNL
jgi:predicted RNA methylase